MLFLNPPTRPGNEAIVNLCWEEPEVHAAIVGSIDCEESCMREREKLQCIETLLISRTMCVCNCFGIGVQKSTFATCTSYRL